MRVRVALIAVVIAALASTSPAATVFQDSFNSGSSLNPGSYPTPTASSTGYNILSTKAATTGPSLSAGALQLSLNAATTSGVVETQALTPAATLTSPGESLKYTFSFVNTGDLLAGGTSSYLYGGIYNSGGSAPVVLNSSGLNTTAGSPYATGGAFGWQGYVARIAPTGGSSQIYTRPAQNGTDTSSQNQDVVGNNAGGGLYDSPAGSSLNSAASTLAALTNGDTYTYQMTVTLNGDASQTFESSLYAGASASGTPLWTQSGTDSSPLATTYDAIAIGYRNSGTSLNPIMTVQSVSLEVSAVPEPASLGLVAAGLGLAGAAARRRLKRA
ncbi:MAG: hypothetical protein RLZZ440_532 [Planctomycetota bacterium]|jgi:hypothetical protein